LVARRRISTIFFALLVSGSIFASELSQEKVSYAFSSLYNGIISAVAAHVAVPQVSLPGVSLDISNDAEMVYSLSFNRADLSSFSSALMPEEEESTWYSRLRKSAISTLSPLSPLAVGMLERMDYKFHDAVLDGKINVEFLSRASNIRGWFDLLFVKDWSLVSFSVKVSVVVSGNRVGVPLAFEGILMGYGESDGSGIVVKTKEMRCNDVEISVEDMKFKMAKGA